MNVTPIFSPERNREAVDARLGGPWAPDKACGDRWRPHRARAGAKDVNDEGPDTLGQGRGDLLESTATALERLGPKEV